MSDNPGSVDLLKRIEDLKPGLSKGHKLIADFFLTNYGRAAYMTAASIGEAVGVSESTVVRFASEIGYDGFPRFQKTLRELVKNRLTSIERIEVASDRISEENVVKAVMQADLENIRYTLESFDHSKFNEVVELLVNAKKIYILGVRSSASLAGFLGFYFNLIFKNVRLVHTTSVSEMFEQILDAEKGDVVIGITFPRYSARTIKAMQFAKKQGANVVAITDNPDNAPARSANVSLIARSDMASFVDSLSAPLSVLNALIVAVGIRKREHITRNLDRLEKIWREYNVYDNMENGDY